MAKKKLKKFLKSVAPLAIAGLGAAMLGGKRRRNNQIKEFLATEGGNKSGLNIIDEFGYNQNPMVTTKDLTDFGKNQGFGFGLMAKKGGRIVKGKKAAVRRKGFGTKKKQANKMRKK